jgi:predicted PurR-regulated permease PerM
LTLADTSSRAGLVFKSLSAAAGVVLGAYLVWGLRSLIVPVTVGGLLAYICRPGVARLERSGVPRGVAIGLLLLVFVLGALFIVNRIRAVMPSDTGVLELRIRALYTLNERYQALMGLDRSLTRGNRIYRLVYGDLDPFVDRVNQLLALTPEEHAQFVASRPRGAHDALAAGSDRLVVYDRANVATLERRARTALAEPATRSAARPPVAPAPKSVAQTPLAALGDIFSTWIISPLVFLFLLRDTGEIKRGLLRAVPNRLFEPALNILADLDRALGDYVRGLFLECCLLGLTVGLLLTIIGVPLRWTIAIGIFTGASNVVPYMGFAAALLSGLAYALLAEDIRPLLPMVSGENFAIWVVVAVALAELLKNVVYEPVVLGGAVNLHPLVVVIGVLGGAILFGPVGMLLAIPTITVVNVLVSSTARQLKAYGLI